VNQEELLKKLREAFKVESEERLASIVSSLLELEKASDKDKQESFIEVIFREAHSMKGAARAVNLTEIESLFQSMEGVLAAIRLNEIPVSQDLFDILHASVGAVERCLTASDENQPFSHKEEITSLARQLEDLKSAGEKESEGEKGKSDARAKGALKPQKGLPKNQKTPQTQLAPSKPMSSETVRISTSKLDSILLKAEELVSLKLVYAQSLSKLRGASLSFEQWRKEWSGINSEFQALRGRVQKGSHLKEKDQNLSQSAGLLEFLNWNQNHIKSLGHEIRLLTKDAEQQQRTLGRMVDDLLDDMKKITMLPFSSLLDTFPRMVRDISREQGKEVDLVIEGGEIEIDRRILEEMRNPLTHLLRNNIDHGLEDPAGRRDQQKPASGTINLTVSQTEGKKVEILLSDDGKGIDLENVKNKAVKLGIISPKESQHLTDREALSLIFRSQVSTSPMVTQISGRGLGLAIVQESVEKLGGLLSVDTEPNKGSSFRMQLPVTLATFRGILIKVADHLFIFPSTHVERILKIQREKVKTVENRATIPLNGRALSLLALADVLALPRTQEQKEGSEFLTAAVLGSGEKRIAFTIDEVLGEQEVLVKGLGKQIKRIPNIAGATILGSGRVVPILNVFDLLKSPLGRTDGFDNTEVSEQEKEANRKSILVAEDSITSRTLIKNILEAAGFNVKTVVDGQEAFTSLKTEEFDLVVSDVDMPRMNGFELTTKIRGNMRLEETPVVLLTGRESREDRERGIDVGANAYIVKSSFDQSNLVEVIQRLI
jgi:two-component system chemotaxis sensor kinase CheA